MEKDILDIKYKYATKIINCIPNASDTLKNIIYQVVGDCIIEVLDDIQRAIKS